MNQHIADYYGLCGSVVCYHTPVHRRVCDDAIGLRAPDERRMLGQCNGIIVSRSFRSMPTANTIALCCSRYWKKIK